MRKLRKMIAVLLSMVMILCLVAGGVEAAAASGKYSNMSFPHAKRYTFRYNSGYDRDWDGCMYYTDDYFNLDPTDPVPNISFMTASYCITLTAMSSNDAGDNWSKKDQNIKALYKKLGFKNFYASEGFTEHPKTDSIGFAIGSKKLKDQNCTLIVVGMRGAGYGSEWGGNFNLGRNGQHKDFSANKDKFLAALKQYIKDNNIKGHVKLWLNGYSRGGAVSNLSAAAIDEGALKGTGIQLGQKDLYCMTFEPAQGALISDGLTGSKYNNIWSFINPNDIVPLVAMKEYGFGRYGRVWNYPTQGNTGSGYAAKRKAMEKLFYAMEAHEVAGEYKADSFVNYKIDLTDGVIAKDKANKMLLPEFEQKLVKTIALDLVGSRANFVSEYQNGFRTILTVIMGKTLLNGNELDVDAFWTALQKNLKEESMETRISKAAAAPYDTTYGFNTVLKDLVVESLNDAGINYLSPADLSIFVTNVVKLLAGLFMADPDMAVTTVMNIKTLINCHYPEVSVAWLMCMDPQYNGVADCF